MKQVKPDQDRDAFKISFLKLGHQRNLILTLTKESHCTFCYFSRKIRCYVMEMIFNVSLFEIDVIA